MSLFTKLMATIVVILVVAVSCTKPDEPNNGENNGSNGDNDTLVKHEFVDLGLPSGRLWATCNVGADAPEDFGDYFAWGETEPNGKYSWDAYKYGSYVNNLYAFNKYCSDAFFGFEGFVDTLTVLEPDDDAATVNWGADWRMPTKEDWEELIQKTTFKWTDQNGVAGWLFTGYNGNSIFLPSAGYWWDGVLNFGGVSIYWSGTLNTDYPNRAWSLYTNSDNFHVCGSNDRNKGQSVRPVRSAR